MTADKAFEFVKSGFASGRMAHAYLVVGLPQGDGGRLTEMMLKLVFCSAEHAPCNTCSSCKHVATRAHPDILWVEPVKKSRKISIDQVRELQHRMFQTPFAGEWKACVILDADRLGAEAANAFLKILEEPPGRSLFLLLTGSPQFLLPTISSRCQRILLSGESAATDEAWNESLMTLLSGAERRKTEERGTGPLVGKGASGPISGFARCDALVRLLKEIKKTVEMEEKEAAAGNNEEKDDEIMDARINARYRETRTTLLRTMLLWYRDIFLLVCGGDEDHLHHRRYIDVIKKTAGSLTYREALCNVKVVETMARQMEKNMPEAQVLNFALNKFAD